MTKRYRSIVYHCYYTCPARKKILECTKCGKRYIHQKDLDKHKEYCKKNSDYRCEKCYFVGDSQESLSLHLQNHLNVVHGEYTQSK